MQTHTETPELAVYLAGSLNAPDCNHQSLSHTHKAILWKHSLPLVHRTCPLPRPRLPALGLGASSPRLVPGTWQVHVDQQGLGGAALSHRCRGLGGGRWGGPFRGGHVSFALGVPIPARGDRVTGNSRRYRVRRGLAGAGSQGVARREGVLERCS